MGFSHDQGLVSRLAVAIPTGYRKRKIFLEARSQQIPETLLQAVYAIETSFRPWWVRAIENGFLWAFVVWWLVTGLGFRNVTVGPFQFGCHWVAHYRGFDYRRKGRMWYTKRSLGLAYDLLKLPWFSFNCEMAALRLAYLWSEAKDRYEEFGKTIEAVGMRYNGTKWYAQTLAALVMYLDAEKQ